MTIAGKDFYLGTYGSPQSYEKYARLIADWNAAGCQQLPASAPASSSPSIKIGELILRYWEFSKTYYVKNGSPTGESENIRYALRPLRKLFASTNASEFGPKSLLLVRQSIIDAGLCRNVINARVSRIRRLFRWAAKNELVPANLYHGLLSVEGLQRGRSAARETVAVTIVPGEHVHAILPCISPQVKAMIMVQELAGMRPQDIRNLRTCDLDMTGDVWIYTPWTHKTEHHGHVRRVAIGPRAQEVLRAFLKPDAPSRYVFNPRDAVAKLHEERRLRRQKARTPSELARPRRKNPRRAPREQYSKTAYETAVAKACKKAGVPHWCPNQLRHNCATKFRRLFGLDAAAAVLGHRLGTVTEVYAEVEFGKAVEILRKIG